MYLQGEGCEQNFVKAKAMSEAAAEQDDADAQYNLGLMFDQSGDVTKAKKWYKRATDKDHEKARNNLEAQLHYQRTTESVLEVLIPMPFSINVCPDISKHHSNFLLGRNISMLPGRC